MRLDHLAATGHYHGMAHRRSPKKSPPKDSIRAKLGYTGGPWTITEMRAMVIDALDQAAATGITHFARANLYLNPVDAQGKIVNRVGKIPLPDIDVPHPYRSAADEHGL